MRIYIPSKGRAQKQSTLARLPDELRDRTTLVVPEDEVPTYAKLGVSTMGCPHAGIVMTRDYIFQHAEEVEKYVMLDDDLIFQRRRADGKITDCSPDETIEAFAWLEAQLNEVAHASFGTRFLGYNATGDFTSPGRMMYVLGYNVQACHEARAYFSKGLEQFSTMEDFNMTLQLLTKGYPNRISLEWRCSPGGSNAPGGCSTWRTTVRQTESARRLAAMYPGIVKLRPKKKWQGMEDQPDMFDVTVGWKKALNQYFEEAV